MLTMTELMKRYKEANVSPLPTNTYYTTEQAAVNCVALVTCRSWVDVVKSLIEQSHFRGNMPSYRTCITDMFRQNGFAPVSCRKRISTLLDECEASATAAMQYIIKTSYGYFAVVPDRETSSYVFAGMSPRSQTVCDGWITELWQYTPGFDYRLGTKRAAKERSAPKENNSLEFRNLNPENKNTGDCSVRGLAAAYGCSWHEALDHLAGAIGFSDPTVNTVPHISTALIKLGFQRHAPIKRANKLVDGKRFCALMDQMYHNGERIFSFIGQTHCAAVLPVKQADGSTRYKIQDTWDSTSRYVGEWFVYREQSPATTEAPMATPLFACGATVMHPHFGKGEVLSVTASGKDRILEIKFPSCGIKKISEAWLQNMIGKERL